MDKPELEQHPDDYSWDKCPDCAEQLNQELMIIKTIQGLVSAVNRELGKLNELTPSEAKRKVLISVALEETDSFEKTTLYELQKAFE